MKILQLTPSYKPAYIYGGPTISVSRLCEALQSELKESNTISIEVFCTCANGESELDVPSGIPQIVDGVKVTYFKRITKDHTHFSPALLVALWKKIQQEKKHHPAGQFLIHIHSWWNLVAILGALIALMLRVPVILSPRGMINNYSAAHKNSLSKKIIHHTIGKKILKNVHLLATSDKEQKEYLEICTPLSSYSLPNIIYLPNKLPLKTITDSNTLRLIFLSRINEVKGLNLLLEALSKVNFSWQLQIAGSGDQNYIAHLKNLIRSLNIASKITWLGQLNNDEKFHYLAESDIFCLTSYTENFANVVIESLAVGTPVFISDQVGLASFVQENKLGYITNLDVNSIASNLEKANAELSTREQISNSSPILIKHKLNEVILAQRYINYYHEIESK